MEPSTSLEPDELNVTVWPRRAVPGDTVNEASGAMLGIVPVALTYTTPAMP